MKIMSLFKPVLVNTKNKLDSVDKVLGQYIVVVDTKELYVDKADAEGNIVRVNVSRSGIFIQAEEPTNAVEGDVWFQIELPSFRILGTSCNFEEGMTWEEFIPSSYNILGSTVSQTPVGGRTIVIVNGNSIDDSAGNIVYIEDLIQVDYDYQYSN
jgi:hypothetical protein